MSYNKNGQTTDVVTVIFEITEDQKQYTHLS